MKGSLARLALMAILLHLSCSSAQAVTWFDSNTRPDGVSDQNVYTAPSEDGAQIVYGGSQENNSEQQPFDIFDSGD